MRFNGTLLAITLLCGGSLLAQNKTQALALKKQWETALPNVVKTFPVDQANQILILQFKRLTSINTLDGSQVWATRIPTDFPSAILSNDGKHLLVQESGRAVCIEYDVGSGEPVRRFGAPTGMCETDAIEGKNQDFFFVKRPKRQIARFVEGNSEQVIYDFAKDKATFPEQETFRANILATTESNLLVSINGKLIVIDLQDENRTQVVAVPSLVRPQKFSFRLSDEFYLGTAEGILQLSSDGSSKLFYRSKLTNIDGGFVDAARQRFLLATDQGHGQPTKLSLFDLDGKEHFTTNWGRSTVGAVHWIPSTGDFVVQDNAGTVAGWKIQVESDD